LKMKSCAFAIALLATLAKAEALEDYKDLCFRCIDEGYAFCSADGISGTCHDVTCKEQDGSYTGEDNKREYGECVLEESSFCSAGETAMLHYA